MQSLSQNFLEEMVRNVLKEQLEAVHEDGSDTGDDVDFNGNITEMLDNIEAFQ